MIHKPSPLLQRYERHVADKFIDFDAEQWTALQNLQILLDELHTYGEKLARVKRWQWKSSPVTMWHGLYLFGEVGRGKSMLMTWFYEACELLKKRRVHFHVFMLEVHLFIHHHPNQNALPLLAKEVRKTTQLLCFDEFFINDIADAMLLSGLFNALFKQGVIIVITSNCHPDKLYPNGLQRASLLPFIDLLHEKTAIIQLNGEQDYRLTKSPDAAIRYFFPLNSHTEIAISKCNAEATFSFVELCGKPKGARDYLTLAAQIDTLVLTHIPQLTAEKQNEARRFITLIDVLYDYKVMLICSAEVAIDDLYLNGKNKTDFERTRSRLIEMQSTHYPNHI
ncbi:MAG: cell division protein ZapE [Methylococcaceae bacterium]